MTGEDGQTLTCTTSGRLKGKVLPVVGDLVDIATTDATSGTIKKVFARRTRLARVLANGSEHVLAANVDQVVLLVAARNPPFRSGAVERLLVYAHAAGLEPVLVLNKCDLVTPAEAQTLLAPWGDASFGRILLSTVTGQGLDELRHTLEGKVSVLVGASGTGKSSTVNAVCPGAPARTGDVSGATTKGRHTTTSSQLYPLPSGGFLVDTPGVKELGLLGLDEESVLESFPEVAEYAAHCRYRNCRHSTEPNCAVQAAIRSGAVGAKRFSQFQKMLGELARPAR